MNIHSMLGSIRVHIDSDNWTDLINITKRLLSVKKHARFFRIQFKLIFHLHFNMN